MLNFCDFIQVYVFSTNHHLNFSNIAFSLLNDIENREIRVPQSSIKQDVMYEPLACVNRSAVKTK